MVQVARPRAVPELGAQPEARQVVADVRTCAVLMSDAAETMHANAAPAGFEGDPAEINHHAMTTTARELAEATAALQVGLAALERYCDCTDDLRTARTRLTERHHDLVLAARALEDLTPTDPDGTDAGLDTDIAAHRNRVEHLDRDVESWAEDVRDAEDRLLAALAGADTPAEARHLVLTAPDVPGLLAQVESIAEDPAAVHAWWLALSVAQREALKITRPEIVGNLDGIPLADRDDANRAHLDALHRTLTTRKAEGDLTDEDDLRLLRTLQTVREALDLPEPKGVPRSYLMLFDPDAANGDGHGAIAHGNPETADHVSVNVPGFNSHLGNLGGVAEDALNIHAQSGRLSSESVASIAWLGYDAPNFDPSAEGLLSAVRDARGVVGEAAAQVGAENLSRFVEGLRVNHHGTPHLTVIGHSYGSTTTAIAAGRDLDADDIVLAGSPGAGDGNDHDTDLHGHVYVASADEDPITHLGSNLPTSLGVDPATKDFGATRIRADNQSDFDLRGIRDDVNLNHSSYFRDEKSLEREGAQFLQPRSLENISYIVVGEGGSADREPARNGNLDWWVKHVAEMTGETAFDVGVHGGPIPFVAARVLGLP